KDADQTPSRGAINEAPLKAGDGGRMSGVWSYNALNKLKSQYPGLKEFWDDTAKAPYLYDETSGLFFTYDNVKSIQEKTKYVDEQDLGGMIAWMASNDAKTTSNKRDELTKATKEGLYGSTALPEFKIVHSDLDVSVSITPYEEAWGASPKGYEITLKNNEVLEESNQVLKAVEKGSETIKAPKLYLKTDQPLVSGDYTAGTVKYENGYTVVDLQSVWEGKNIEPGQTYQFKLKGEAEIESIELVQRMSTDGPEMYSQVIYGEGIDEETPEVNTAPIFKGVHTKTLTVGDTFDILEGVTATDKEDGDLTASITVQGDVNSLVVGEYSLTYSVTDSKNLTTTKERVIMVVEKDTEEPVVNTAPVLHGVLDKTIRVGESIDLMAGITAMDKEDGDLTSAINVLGEVNTQVAGEYVVTYSVADSKNLETVKERMITVKEKAVVEVDFGVGQGIEWPKQVNSPFIDMVSWITKPGYTNNGAPNLAKISEDTGVKFFNLGFIQSLGTIKDNKVEWGWGGHRVLGETGTIDTQYEGIKKSIIDIRELGGDVTISIGGLNGVTPWQVTQDVGILTNTYLDIVKGYGLTRLDLDIEGAAQNKVSNIANAKAIKNVQDQTDVKIVLTLPVLPSGLTSVQLDVLEAYLSQGVDVHLVNLMTMCYGESSLLPGENYGTGSLRAVDSTKDQIKQYYKQFTSIELTDEQAYGKIGTTPSIGFEGVAHPIFTSEWAQLIVDHATSRGLGMTSFWSMNRDAVLESNQGINQPYEFTNIFKTFAQDTEVGPEQNSAPVIEGVSDVTLTVGDEFNVLSGVTATDKEDGDLTAFITVEGTVDLNRAGVYSIVYLVSDRDGLTTSKERVITVVEKENSAPILTGVDDVTILLGEAFDVLAGVVAFDDEDGDLLASVQVEGEVNVEVVGNYTLVYSVVDSQNMKVTKTRVITVKDPLSDTYDATKIYLQGDKVIYNGQTYTAKWWVQGEAPDQSMAWEKEILPNEDGSLNYEVGMIFVGGELVHYNGQLYEAKWWTTSLPGSDDSWNFIK
ncbi:MAG: immunoglobulin-like domain-containing protein, partial [Turicibacter sp.]